MNFIEVATLAVRREFRHGTYERLDGTMAPCLELTRDCGLGCKCGAQITKATPGPELAVKVLQAEGHDAPHEGPGAASSRTVPLDAVVVRHSERGN